MSLSASRIITKYAPQLSTRPEYYAGRGNNSDDLNSGMLEQLFEGIAQEVGDKAADAFVHMVRDLNPDASATTFLTALYRLENAGWAYNRGNLPTHVDALSEIASKAIENDDIMNQQIAALSALGAFSTRNEPASRITEEFLRNHGEPESQPPAGPYTEAETLRAKYRRDIERS